MDLIIATGNAHKLNEIRALLEGLPVSVRGLDSLTDVPPLIEDGETFAENAIRKARPVALYAHAWVMADDAGLEVEALDGAPGVFSARFAGEPSNDAANNQKLLDLMAQEENRRACFRCAIALCSPEGNVEVVEGSCHGTILKAPRGAEGFGYDPLFLPVNHSLSFAELDNAHKNRLSHRGQALAAARATWWPDGRFTFPALG